MPDLSRRGFLGGTAGAVAAAALSSSLLRPGGPPRVRRTAFAGRSAPRSPAAAQPLAGATVNADSYGVKGAVQAAQMFDGYVGLPLAVTIQKIYVHTGDFESTPPVQMTQLAPDGCQFLVSVEPSRNMHPVERTRLANWLAMLNEHQFNYRVVLFSECNDKAFTTTEGWLAYWSYYAPTIQDAGVLCGYDPGCNHLSISRAIEFFPSDPLPDELWMDYYCTPFRAGVRVDQLIATAQAAGVTEAGLAEWGWSSGPVVFNPMIMPWWNEYCSYLSNLISETKINLGAILFASYAQGMSVDVINSSDDPRIPGIQQVVNAIQAAA